MNHINIIFDQSLIDDDVQLTHFFKNVDASYKAKIDVPAIGLNFSQTTGFSAKDLDSKNYKDALAIKDYKLFYSNVLPLDTIRSLSINNCTKINSQSFHTVSETDLATLGSSSSVHFDLLFVLSCRVGDLLLIIIVI